MADGQNRAKFKEIRIERPDGYYGNYLQATLNLTGSEPASPEDYSRFFAANRNFEIVRISEVHSSASSDAGTCSVDVKVVKDGGSVVGAQSCLTSEISLTATANTIQEGELSEVRSSLLLKTDDCLAVEPEGDLAGLRNLLLTVYLKAV